MRPAVLAGLTVLLFASHAVAQQPPYRAIVVDPEVKVRAGPSDKFAETGTLSKGNVVYVEREEGGWLAVAAPPNSVSWIQSAFVEDTAPDRPTPKNGIVYDEGPVTLAAGKVGLSQPLDIRREKVPQGTIVVIIGPPVKFDGKMWLPIEPPAGDVRYLPKTAVTLDKPINDNYTVRIRDTTGGQLPAPATVAPDGPSTTVGVVASAGSGGGSPARQSTVNHPLWLQAEAAERAGRPEDAEKLYFELARLMNGPNGEHDIANLCYTRIHALREKKRLSTTGTAGTLQPPVKDERAVRPGPPQALSPTGSGSTRLEETGTEQERWIGPGILRRSALTPDGTSRRTYLLEDASGVKAYVIPGPGVDLERLIGKRVSVYGVTSYRSGLQKPIVTVSEVVMP